MSRLNKTVVGVDACPFGWLATVIDADGVRTETYEGFGELREAYSNADRILVDIPLGLPENERRRCDEDASDLLGCRGISVFYPPCGSAAELSDYQAASDEHRDRIGHGLSQQAHNIARKILQVGDVVGGQYDSVVRESHPELCFAALNGQPIAYSKSSDRGRGLRMKLLSDELDVAESLYQNARDEYLLKEVRRDDILDSMVLAVAARKANLTAVPPDPSPDEPRIYFPEFTIPTLKVE
jgi:predicted RNase H-like nuclease